MMLIAITLTATFYLGTPNWSLDVSPVFLIEARLPRHPFLPGHIGGLALPHLIVLDPRPWFAPMREEVLAHEMKHIRQFEALGPAFTLAYALTGGAPFEDYLNPDGAMWLPPPGMHYCPMLRFSNQHTLLLPCWQFWRRW